MIKTIPLNSSTLALVLAITSPFSRLNLKNRIFILYSGSFLLVTGISFSLIYYFSAGFRREEFVEILKDKTIITLQLLVKVKKTDQDIVRLFDDQIVSQLYDEKILLFDQDVKLIYSSVGDTKLEYPIEAVKRLKEGEKEISYTEAGYDVIAHHIRYKDADYFAIGKAYDEYGRKKLRFLSIILIVTFSMAVILMFLLNGIISRKITTPVLRLIREVDQITANNLKRVFVSPTDGEIAHLSEEFNKMLDRMEQAFTYQKNLIHHISHELKTPISVLISNIERQDQTFTDSGKAFLEFQKAGLMQLADIINALLEITRLEQIRTEQLDNEIPVLDLIFECAEEIKYINPETEVEIVLDENILDASSMNIPGNERLLKIAFRNLIKNASDYSDSKKVRVQLYLTEEDIVILLENDGATLSDLEKQKLFTEYFRGHNSRNNAGFGLGLVMVNKILLLHQASITYRVNEKSLNEFSIRFSKW